MNTEDVEAFAEIKEQLKQGVVVASETFSTLESSDFATNFARLIRKFFLELKKQEFTDKEAMDIILAYKMDKIGK